MEKYSKSDKSGITFGICEEYVFQDQKDKTSFDYSRDIKRSSGFYGIGGSQNLYSMKKPNTYSLTTGDFFTAGTNSVEKDGSAQKVINAILDTAYVAYNSGVQLGSGLSSMTVSRTDLSLGSTQVTGISGAINKYSRSYTVTFGYTQTGFIANINGALHTEALPDISDDLQDEDTDPKPF